MEKFVKFENHENRRFFITEMNDSPETTAAEKEKIRSAFLEMTESEKAIFRAAAHTVGAALDSENAAAETGRRERKKAEYAAARAADENAVIDGKNLYKFADKIAYAAARTNYAASGQPAALKIWYSVCSNIHARNAANAAPPVDDNGIGADVIQTAAAALWEYGAGKRLDDTAYTETKKDGEPRAVDVARAAFRAVNNFIHGERQIEYKRVYTEDLIMTENGNAVYSRALAKIRLNDFKATERAREFDAIFTHAAETDNALTDTEKVRFLAHYFGDSVRKIATDNGTTPRAVQKSLENARRKIAAAYGVNAAEIIG